LSIPFKLAALLLLGASLGGCTYDYLQRTDRVAFSAGNAVRANIERETSNPTSKAHYRTKGLGRNGNVTAAAEAGAIYTP
jgi:recombination DNA repair RAD52 pathway protein